MGLGRICLWVRRTLKTDGERLSCKLPNPNCGLRFVWLHSARHDSPECPNTGLKKRVCHHPSHLPCSFIFPLCCLFFLFSLFFHVSMCCLCLFLLLLFLCLSFVCLSLSFCSFESRVISFFSSEKNPCVLFGSFLVNSCPLPLPPVFHLSTAKETSRQARSTRCTPRTLCTSGKSRWTPAHGEFFWSFKLFKLFIFFVVLMGSLGSVWLAEFSGCFRFCDLFLVLRL